MNKIETSTSRLSWIDVAKGLGIILVVYGHVLRGLNDAHLVSPAFFKVSDQFVYSFHMPLFFILSGFFFEHSYHKKREGFVADKVRTILYPFAIWSILQTIIEVLLSRYTNSKISTTALLTCLFIPRAQFWFLFALFFINALNAFIFKLIPRPAIYFSIFISLIYLFITVAYPFDKILQFLLFFNSGILIFRHREVLIVSCHNIYFQVISISLFLFLEYLMFREFLSFNKFSFVATGILGSFVVIVLSIMISKFKISASLLFLGKNSMVIYLVHILAASGVRIILLRLLGVTDTFVHITVGVLCGLTVPLIIYRISNKDNFLRALFRFPKHLLYSDAV